MAELKELQDWTKKFCGELELPVCEAMVHIDMDDYIGIIGEKEGGCLIVYEADNPEKYCVSVEKSVLRENEGLARDTLYISSS